ncbi:prepilin peptidase [Candidatus Saccharibacteria bacterium]|nr:prepilin peptidase [Candidatus Saccharibacteria bacterium]MBI3337800.1 prepilin peptidase [Candidatus Saccharibacteria bacterium]
MINGIIIVFVGLVLGSFVNALVWRLHLLALRKAPSSPDRLTSATNSFSSLDVPSGTSPSDKTVFARADSLWERGILRKSSLQSTKHPKKPDNKKYSIVSGRSMCPDCRHQLAWYDLIPVISWLGLRGRCRYCHRPISWQYPLVEILTAVTFITSYVYWPYSWSAIGITLFIVWIVSLISFMALAVYDLRWFILPDKIVFPLVGLAAIQIIMRTVLYGEISPILGGLIGVVTLAGLFYALFQFSKGQWIGGGDVKLAVALGMLAGGAAESVLLLFLASLIGTLVSLPLLLSKKLKKNSRIPFGPLLLMATFIVYIFGSDIINWLKLYYFY